MINVWQIVERASIVLTDPMNIRWTQDEIGMWVCDGARELTTVIPSAYVKHESMMLESGDMQYLPEDCRLLLEVRVVFDPFTGQEVSCPRKVSREMLSVIRPRWVGRPGRGEVKEFCYDPGDPTKFYVFPPQPNDWTRVPTVVELVYQAVPPCGMGDGWWGLAPLRDDYGVAVLHYVLFRAYTKDAEFAGQSQLAAQHYQLFQQALQGVGAGPKG